MIVSTVCKELDQSSNRSADRPLQSAWADLPTCGRSEYFTPAFPVRCKFTERHYKNEPHALSNVLHAYPVRAEIPPPSELPRSASAEFGWFLADGADSCTPTCQVTTHHVSWDDFLRQFWEVEKKPVGDHALTPDKSLALHHFNNQCSRMSDGRFIIPLCGSA